MKKERKGQIVAGIILILLGLSFSGIRFIIGFHHNTFFLLLGGLFIAAYFYKDLYGLLIPGCLIIGLGITSGHFGLFRYSPYYNTLGLGLGFVAIYVIDLLNKGKSHWWPLIPGGILTFLELSTRPYNFWGFFHVIWPIIIILLGLYMILNSLGLIKCFKKNEQDHK